MCEKTSINHWCSFFSLLMLRYNLIDVLWDHLQVANLILERTALTNSNLYFIEDGTGSSYFKPHEMRPHCTTHDFCCYTAPGSWMWEVSSSGRLTHCASCWGVCPCGQPVWSSALCPDCSWQRPCGGTRPALVRWWLGSGPPEGGRGEETISNEIKKIIIIIICL